MWRTARALDPQGCCGGDPRSGTRGNANCTLYTGHFLPFTLSKNPPKRKKVWVSRGRGQAVGCWPTRPAPYQVLLDGQDAAAGGLAVGPLASDDDGLRVAVLCRKVNFGVAFFPNLQGERPVRS